MKKKDVRARINEAYASGNWCAVSAGVLELAKQTLFTKDRLTDKDFEQECAIAVWEAKQTFRAEATFATFSQGVIDKKRAQFFERRVLRPEITACDMGNRADGTSSFDHAMERREDGHIYLLDDSSERAAAKKAAAVDTSRLSERAQGIFQLKAAGRTDEEIALAYGMTVTALKMKLVRWRKRASKLAR